VKGGIYRVAPVEYRDVRGAPCNGRSLAYEVFFIPDGATSIADDRDLAEGLARAEEAKLSLAYAITIHKSQGSEFPAVVVPLAMQHYLLLQRNLVYTAMTRGRRLVVLVGQRKALAMAVRNDRAAERFSCLYDRLVRSQIDPSGRSYSN